MNIEAKKIRSYRLHAHHLDGKIPIDGLINIAGACGLQNTPPGAWETALYNRLEGCTLPILREALYEQKSLLQAWSYRGVPVVFPTGQSDIFLTALISQDGEWPWIYTRGITGALDYLQISFDDLLLRTKEAAKHLDSHIIISKETLDKTLAEIIKNDLPQDKRALWCGPSMYGNPEKQTVGEAAVSFLLRPCSFSSLVVFGERQGASPGLRGGASREGVGTLRPAVRAGLLGAADSAAGGGAASHRVPPAGGQLLARNGRLRPGGGRGAVEPREVRRTDLGS